MGTPSTELDEAFEAARAEFVGGLKRRKLAVAQALSKATTVDDVRTAISEIEEQQQRSGKLRALGRLKPVVRGLQEYTGVLEVFVQVKPDIIGLIWGPLKFILKSVSDVIALFDKMMEVFSDIGRILPQFQKYQELLDKDQIQPVLTLFYKEILAIYSVLLEFLKHPGRNSFIDAVWPLFRGKIDVIQDHIKDLEKVMTSHVTLEHVLQSHRESRRAVNEAEKAEEARNRQYWKEMEAEVSPRLYDGRLDKILSESCDDSGLWLEKRPQFRNWKDRVAKSRCLWLSGIPGAGKTYLAANSIRRLQDAGDAVLFLIFSHSDPAPSRVQALHSLLFQALKDDASLRPEVFAAYSANERKFGSNTEWVRGLLSKVLRDAPMFIVVDGLDELAETLRCGIARDLFEVVQSCDQVRLLVSSRDESDLRKLFTSQRAVQIRVQENNSSDVKQYARTECDKLVDRLRRFGASDEECTQIQETSSTVVENAKGMMMYAHLIFRVAKDLGTGDDIQNEFLDLPKDLDEAYGRILVRIQRNISANLREVAVRVLSWVACAQRPLREEELLQVLVIEAGATDFTKGRKYRDDITHACGPIIEIVEGVVHFVHFSAKEYLLHKQSDRFLDLAAAHIEAATICATYLSFSTLDLVFETGPGDVDTTKYEIHQGTFVFLDYATLSWIYHITMIGMHSKTTDACLPADLVASIERLLQKRGQSQFRRTASAKVLLPRFRIFKDNAALQSSLCSAAYFWGRAEHGLLDENQGPEATEITDPTNLAVGLKTFRANLETMICPDSEHTSVCRCKDLLQLHGTPVYHCDFWHCIAFRKGYNTTFARDDHAHVHSRTARFPKIGNIGDYLSPDGDSAQSESDTEVLKVSEISQDQVLEDAICSGRFDLIRKFWPKKEPPEEFSRKLLQLAALKNLPDTVEFMVFKGPPMLQNQCKANALAVAIETENIHSIKALLSTSPEIIDLQSRVSPQVYCQIPHKRCGLLKYSIRLGIDYRYSGFHRAFSLFSPELMKVLVDECGVTVPANLEEVELLFRCVGFRNADPDDISRRFEAMKPYIHESWKLQKVHDDWLQQLIAYRGPHELLIYCLENGADPNAFKVALNFWSGKGLAEVFLVLFRFGANPNHLELRHRNGEMKGKVKRLLSECDMSWEEFAKRAKDGEPLEWFYR